MPPRCSRCDSNSPAGPAPMIATWVRIHGSFRDGLTRVGLAAD
jgi:hypothetical protein